MRLTPTERAAITRAVTAVFGPAAVPKLFGSRTDDTARGGDIDLFIANVTGSALDVQYQRLALLAQLHLELGEQHIDVVVQRVSGPELPIHRIAWQTGIDLTP